MGYKITEIEGIGAKMAAKLEAAGIKTTDHLLKHCATPAGRKKTAETCGISPKLILKWANMADVMRVSGIGEEYSELLEAANCNTVKQLARRNPANLTRKMNEINEKKKLVRSVPTETQVKKWIEKAGALTPILTY
jgi:predicted flap endonuclease-1-like 5' DNA nuclease